MDYTVHGILQARILEWVAFAFSRGSSQPRDWTQVSCIAGGFFTSWATREALFTVHTPRIGQLSTSISQTICCLKCSGSEWLRRAITSHQCGWNRPMGEYPASVEVSALNRCFSYLISKVLSHVVQARGWKSRVLQVNCEVQFYCPIFLLISMCLKGSEAQGGFSAVVNQLQVWWH